MADLSKTIQIVFEAVDQTGGAIANVGKGIEDMAGAVETATQPLADITQGILAFDAAVVGLAAVIGSKAIAETAKFEESLYLVQKQLGENGPSMEQARQDIEAVALAYGTNANTVAESTAAFLAAGYDYESAAKLVDASTQLMIAGELDASTATDAITSSLAGFKIPAEEAAAGAVKIGDVLNKIGDISSGLFTEIVDGFKTIAPTAKDAGLSMEEAAAAIATIVDTGYSGSEAANALKSGLVQLIDPPKDAKDALAALGVELTDSNGKQKLAGDIMGELAGKYAGLTEEQKLQTAAVIFGKDQAGKLNALLGDWGKSQDYVAQMLDKTTGATGSMAKEVEGKLNTLQSSIDRSNEAWRQFLENLGAELTVGGNYQDLVDSIGQLGIAFKTVITAGDLDPVIGVFEQAFGDIEGIIQQVAANLPEAFALIDWSGFLDAIEDLRGSVGGIFEDIDLSTPEGLEKVIQQIVDVGTGLINTTSGIVDGLKPLFEVIGGIVKAFTDLDPAVQKAIGFFLGFSTTINAVSGVIGAFGAAITGAGGMIAALGKLNPALQAAGVFLAAFELGKWLGEVTGYGPAWDNTVGKFIDSLRGIPEVTKPADEALGRMDDNLDKVAKTLGVGSLSMEEFNQAVADGKLKFNEATGTWEKAGESLAGFDDATKASADSARTLAEAMLKSGELSQTAFDAFMAGDQTLESLQAVMAKTAAETAVLNDATKDATSTAAYWGDALDAVKQKLDQGYLTQEEYNTAVKGIVEAADKSGVALHGLSQGMDETAKTAAKAAEDSEKFALEWEKILSQERQVIFKAQADIQVAQIEADAERAKAAMEMLSTSFENTGEVLTELIGIWAGLEGLDQIQVTEWIEKEYAIREKLAQAQIDLVNAEIARMEAQTALLEQGGVQLTIQSDGLEPELEAFMMRVIDKVRVSVAGSYEEFLLGCGAGA